MQTYKIVSLLRYTRPKASVGIYLESLISGRTLLHELFALFVGGDLCPQPRRFEYNTSDRKIRLVQTDLIFGAVPEQKRQVRWEGGHVLRVQFGPFFEHVCQSDAARDLAPTVS